MASPCYDVNIHRVMSEPPIMSVFSKGKTRNCKKNKKQIVAECTREVKNYGCNRINEVLK